jgi:hypothetical protein
MRKNLLVLFILLSFVLPSAALAKDAEKNAVTITAAERKMAEAITAKQLKEYLYFVASDEMGGRDTPSQGLDLTAKFIGMMLSRWGFKPAGDDGTFFQKMMVKEELMDAESTKLKINDENFNYTEDFFLLEGEGVGNGQLVFGKDGWMVKSKNIDAFAGIDVKDKIVVIYSEDYNLRGLSRPKGVTEDDLKGEKGVDWADPITYAQAKGAKGVILVANGQIMGFWERLKNFMGRGGRPQIEGLQDKKSFPFMLVSDKVGKAIFAGESSDQKSANAFSLSKNADINVVKKVTRTPTQNVVAVWEGSDPKLKQEMVAVGAHYDHVGTRPDAQGEDKIWNGADDDGSGTVAVLAIAEALAKAPQRPKRSVLLVWHAGEEKGLLGSAYFNKYPTVDIKNVVTQLNIDMIGRSKKQGDTNARNKELSGENEIYVIGSEMMSSTLGSITKETNSAYLNMNYDYKYDDPKDPNRFFFRSDHFNYAQNGIPIVFWFDGEHEDYHGAGDSPDKIDYQKMEKVTRTIFLTMWEIAELNERPKVDKQLPTELTDRN